MKCNIEQQETCEVEKRGCEGCYYNDEIKVGEYVRTKNKGIQKIAYLRPNATVNKYAYFIGYDNDGDRINGILKTIDIIKHSYNIIDLIEVRRLCKWRTNNRYLERK